MPSNQSKEADLNENFRPRRTRPSEAFEVACHTGCVTEKIVHAEPPSRSEEVNAKSAPSHHHSNMAWKIFWK